MKSVCFSGHRRLKISKEMKLFLYYKICELVENGCDNFYAGGALGWDMLCEETIINLKKEKYPHIHLNLILPCPPEEQTLKWSQKDIKRYQNIISQSDYIFTVSDSYYDGCMKERNELMLKLCDCLVCYFNPKRFASGTGQTVRMAEKKGIRIFNLFNDTVT